MIVANMHSDVDIAAHSALLNIGPMFHYIPIGTYNSLSGFIGKALG